VRIVRVRAMPADDSLFDEQSMRFYHENLPPALLWAIEGIAWHVRR
jgi:hypothetical protein